MKRLALLLFLALASNASAQSEVFVEQASSTFGVSTDVIIGANNGNAQAALNAALAEAGVSPATNVAAITQEGAGNQVDLTQQGVGNRLGLYIQGNSNQIQLSQIGNYNEFTADISGDGNTLGPESIQAGTSNQYVLISEGVNGELHTLAQYGNENQATQVVGPGLKPASIEQRGNGLQVTVERR